ncbi:hypothetical protein NDU88_001745 [Pleurodeles waltl]|uniref:Uncharacterized protein n=1 Tax=Pleurodeles waltl TaxID=8319 RepID=A0AAV7M1D0_PLEWA|nr:hypothetical protein NDU88_001745 [Pleurodeles waltl]
MQLWGPLADTGATFHHLAGALCPWKTRETCRDDSGADETGSDPTGKRNLRDGYRLWLPQEWNSLPHRRKHGLGWSICLTWTRRRLSTTGPGPLTAEEAQEERQRVVAAVALMRDSSLSNLSPAREMIKEQTDSDSESVASTHSSVILPVVTPGTSDELI